MRQIKGLASGVHRIHGDRNTFEAENSTPVSNHATILKERMSEVGLGRHGDIKPENILWLNVEAKDSDILDIETSVLILSDFGQMQYYTTLTRSRKLPGHIVDTPAYAPPEAKELTACAQTSRAYDIWSLGCTYLEFVIWLLDGWDVLCLFAEERGETFYTLPASGTSGATASEVLLEESVRKWIAVLHRMPRCSKFIHEFVDLISLMLVVNPEKRIRCGELNDQLSAMIEKANDPEYLIKPRPSHPLCCCQLHSNPPAGTPLPAHPSFVQDVEPSEHIRGKLSSKEYWRLATQTRFPLKDEELCRGRYKWARAVAKFHQHEVAIEAC